MTDVEGELPPTPSTAPAGPHKSLTIRKRNTDGAPVTFNINEQKFTAYPHRVPTLVMLDLPGMSVSMDSTPMWDLFKAALGDDYERFRRLVRSPALEFEAEDIREILYFIVEQTAEVPTRPPTS